MKSKKITNFVCIIVITLFSISNTCVAMTTDDSEKFLIGGSESNSDGHVIGISSGEEDKGAGYALYQGVSATDEFCSLLDACVQKKENRAANIQALKDLIRTRGEEIGRINCQSIRGARSECCGCDHEHGNISPVRYVAEHADDKENQELLAFLLDNNFVWEHADEVLEHEYADRLPRDVRSKLLTSPGYSRATTGNTAKKQRCCRRVKCCCLSCVFIAAIGTVFATFGGAFSGR